MSSPVIHDFPIVVHTFRHDNDDVLVIKGNTVVKFE